MTTLVQIKDNKNLVRDIHSKAVLSTDKNALNEYLMKKELSRKQNAEKEEMKMRMEQMEKDMQIIKSLLLDIAEVKNNANS
jgi:tetrahydrodipicolinate N-succinyltransferase